MNPSDLNKYAFAILVVGVPGLVHAVFAASHYAGSNPTLDWFRTWYPVSLTAPFAFLALLFLAHCDWLKSKSRQPAYCGTLAALIAMSAVSFYIVFNTPSEADVGPTAASISIILTPFYYLPFLVFAYVPGAIAGRLRTRL